MPLDLTQEPHLFRSPLRRNAIIVGVVDAPVELVQVHGVKAVFEASVFCLAAVKRLFVLPPLVGLARLQCSGRLVQHLLVETELIEKASESLVEYFLANIVATATGITTSAVSGMSGAVIVDIFARLDLGHDGTSTVAHVIRPVKPFNEPRSAELPIV